MTILITGTAGFIGYHLTARLIREGFNVIGVDNINAYYDINLKYSRLNNLGTPSSEISNSKFVQSNFYSNFTFIKIDLANKSDVFSLFKKIKPDIVCHLAAQAGVRYSFENPDTYIHSNITATLNILEACRFYPVKHLLYASSSSVYGFNKKIPFNEQDNVDFPVSLYAATKKSNELMAFTYAHLFNIPSTGLRFFTVYGPWGRPDMALFKFTHNILNGKPIEVYNNGEMYRDFTYIDDIIESVYRLLNLPPSPTENIPVPYTIYNIGNGSPVKLLDFIKTIEEELSITAEKVFLPLQPGDVVATYADTSKLYETIKFKPQTNIKKGIKAFIDWYKSYYNIYGNNN